MAGREAEGGSWSLVVPVLVAGVLAAIALVTVEQAGCDDPGHLVLGSRGYELIGGCVEPGDLPVHPATDPEVGTPDPRSPLRP
jgi:hypothetical protein